MVDYKNKYQGIVDELVEESFPELRRKRIKIIFIPFFMKFGTVLKGWRNDYIILFGRVFDVKNKKSLIGFFVHELCHLSDLRRFSVFGSFFRYNVFNDLMFLFRYNSFERRADVLSVEKGYAREIFSNMKKISEKYPKWIVDYIFRRGYMSPDKVKSYAKEIGKW